MKNIDIEKVIRNMEDAGCCSDDLDRVKSMHEAGLDSEIIRCLKRCRCDLIEELHESQRRVDCMDHLIRATEKM
jgi:hypothetical protein